MSIGHLWDFPDISVRISLEFQWNFCSVFVGLLWDFHKISLPKGFLWDAYGIST